MMKIKFEMSEESFRSFWNKIRDLLYELEIHRLAFRKIKEHELADLPAVCNLLDGWLQWSRNDVSLHKKIHHEFDESVSQLLAAYREKGEPIDLEKYSKLFLPSVSNKLPH